MNIDLKRLRNDATLVATEHKTFESRLDLQTFLHQLALQYNKEFTVAPNNNKTRYEVRCTAAECPFKIIARAPIDSEVWCITKAVTHAAECVASPKTYFPPKIIAYILKEEFKCERPFSPKALEKSSSVINNGTSAARTIRAAQNYLYGDRESSYRLLPITGNGTISSHLCRHHLASLENNKKKRCEFYLSEKNLLSFDLSNEPQSVDKELSAEEAEQLSPIFFLNFFSLVSTKF
ncbi:hypothetical protein P9112_006120 [Eukaryota sp. TZLM1-RC]